MNFKICFPVILCALFQTTCIKSMKFEKFLFSKHALPHLTRSAHQASTHLPYLASGVGLGCIFAAVECSMQEKNEAEMIARRADYHMSQLDLKSLPSILEAFKLGSDTQKEQLATALSKKISWHSSLQPEYTVDDISSFLKNTSGTAHRTITLSISRNITRFTPHEIKHILNQDTCEETHQYIAQALHDNYTALTSYSLLGITLRTNKQWRDEYASLLKSLSPYSQKTALEPILKNIELYNVFNLMYYTNSSDSFLNLI